MGVVSAKNNRLVTLEDTDSRAHESVRVEGVVTESLPNAIYRVKLAGGQLATAHVSTELRMHIVRILPGDKVLLELSRFDLNRGRIIQRV